MEFIISPPKELRPGARMKVPVIVSVRAGDELDEYEDLVLFLSLRDASGKRAAPVRISGETSDNVHCRGYSCSRGYSKFENLSIATPGDYRIRVYMSVAGQSGTVARCYLDSDIIRVHHCAAATQRPCKC
jgi:hypothetical protein